jgi:hypothetical protein
VGLEPVEEDEGIEVAQHRLPDHPHERRPGSVDGGDAGKDALDRVA